MGLAEDEYCASQGVSTGTPHSRSLIAKKQTQGTQNTYSNRRGDSPSKDGSTNIPNSISKNYNFYPPVKQGISKSYQGNKLLFRPHGTGTSEYSNGYIYEGCWSFGKWSGMGVLTLPGKWVYRGRFKRGMLYGNGTLEVENGMVFEGRFRESVPNGKGTLKFGDGAVFTGKWTEIDWAKGKYSTPENSAVSARIVNNEVTIKKGMFSTTKVVRKISIREILRGNVPT